MLCICDQLHSLLLVTMSEVPSLQRTQVSQRLSLDRPPPTPKLSTRRVLLASRGARKKPAPLSSVRRRSPKTRETDGFRLSHSPRCFGSRRAKAAHAKLLHVTST